MLTFLQNNPLLVIGIAGAVLTLVASIYGILAKKKTVSVVATFMVLSRLVVVAKELITHEQEQKAKLLEDSRQAQEKLLAANRRLLIEDIQNNVIQTRLTVESIAAKLETIPLDEMATPLVTVRGAGGQAERVEMILARGKGGPGVWGAYADWLDQRRRSD